MSGNNPGERLHALLIRGGQFEFHLPSRQVWATLLNTEEASPDLHKRLAMVMRLPIELDAIFEKHFPAKRPMQKHWFEPIKTAFRVHNLSGQWETFYVHINDVVLDSLGMAASLVSPVLAEDDAVQGILWDVNSKLIGILGELENSGLDESVKSALFKSIMRIIVAIDEYSIAGCSNVMDSLEMAVGRMLFDEPYREAIKETEVGKKLSSVFHDLAAIYAVMDGALKIGTGVWDALTKS